MNYYKKPQGTIKYDENGNQYIELLPINITPKFNYVDYSQIQNLQPINNVPQQQRWFMSKFNKDRHNVARNLFELGTFPASLNPLAGTIIGGIYGGLAAKDAYQNGLNWSNGIQLGLSLPLVGRGLYSGFNKVNNIIQKSSNPAPNFYRKPGSLVFYQRPEARISSTKRLNIPKGNKNNVRSWHVAVYPGYQLKILMKGSPLEKQLSKIGTINVNSIKAQANKASNVEKAVIDKVLDKKFNGQKSIDYNDFKKAVQDELITYDRQPATDYETYGMNRIGFDKIVPSIEDPRQMAADLPRLFPKRFEKKREPFFGVWDKQNKKLLSNEEDFLIPEYQDLLKPEYDKIAKSVNGTPNTFTFVSPRIGYGDNTHYTSSTLGHSRTFTTETEPDILHVMESQSDWGQHPLKEPKFSYSRDINGNTNLARDAKGNVIFVEPGKGVHYSEANKDNYRLISEAKELWRNNYPTEQAKYLHDNYLQRQIQENLRYAAENGQTKMRYPTSETAAKIEGYQKTALPRPTRYQEIELRDQLDKMWKEYYDANEAELRNIPYLELESIGRKNIPKYSEMLDKYDQLRSIPTKYDYAPEHQTILKKYTGFPKLFQKLYKGQNVRTVSDTKGNTWYEVDVPKDYLNQEWQYKQGGKFTNRIEVTGYPLVDAESEGLTEWFNKNPNVAGMAIGGGLNDIEGERRVVLNPNLKGFDARNSVYMNESYRHFFDENNTVLPAITFKQKRVYRDTPYEGNIRRIQETEAARYLSGDPSHHLKKRQKAKLAIYNFVYPDKTLLELTAENKKAEGEKFKYYVPKKSGSN